MIYSANSDYGKQPDNLISSITEKLQGGRVGEGPFKGNLRDIVIQSQCTGLIWILIQTNLRKNKPVMEMSALPWEVHTKGLLFVILDVIMVL